MSRVARSGAWNRVRRAALCDRDRRESRLVAGPAAALRRERRRARARRPGRARRVRAGSRRAACAIRTPATCARRCAISRAPRSRAARTRSSSSITRATPTTSSCTSRGDPLTFKELQDDAAQPAGDDQARGDRCVQVGRGHAQGRRASRRVRGQRRQPEAVGHGAADEQRRRRAVAGVARTRRLGVHASSRVGPARRRRRRRRQQVTIAEAYHYAYARTRADTATTGTPQRPSFSYELSGQGELVLAQLEPPKTAQMTLPKATRRSTSCSTRTSGG